MKQTALKSLVVVMLYTLSNQAAAEVQVGIDSKKLVIECSGELVVTGSGGEYVSKGYGTRAGKYVPPSGSVTITLETKHLSAGCGELYSKMGIDLVKQKFESTVFTEKTDLKLIKKLGQSHVGKIVKFKADQNFYYKMESGYLPFFPLLHSETIQLDSPGYYVQPSYFQVDEQKVYGVSDSEENKVQLSELIFAHINYYGLNAGISNELLSPLVNSYPKFENNFANYKVKLLALFDDLEKNQKADKYENSELQTVANGIVKMTHEYPAIYAFKIPELASVHPSLLITYGQKKLNITSEQLDTAIDLIEQNLSNGSLAPNVKAAFKEPLESLSGGYHSGSILHLASKYTKAKANALLKTYF